MFIRTGIVKAGATLVIGSGLLIALAAWPPMAGLLTILADLIFLPVDGAQDLSAPETRLMMAISGGVLVGWGVMVWLVATRLADRDPALARTLVLVPLAAWFVVDSAGSVASGAPLNVLFNCGFVVVFAAAFWGRPAEEAA